jgi:hypothetical protein
VQNGWVRGNERKLDAKKSTLLEPILSLRAADVSPMPRDRYVKVTIPLYYEGHTYRAGSRVRVTITAPNGDQPIWSFGETQPKGRPTISIAHSKGMPSSLILPAVSGVNVPTGLPPCPGPQGRTVPGLPALREPANDSRPSAGQARWPGRESANRAPWLGSWSWALGSPDWRRRTSCGLKASR